MSKPVLENPELIARLRGLVVEATQAATSIRTLSDGLIEAMPAGARSALVQYRDFNGQLIAPSIAQIEQALESLKTVSGQLALWHQMAMDELESMPVDADSAAAFGHRGAAMLDHLIG